MYAAGEGPSIRKLIVCFKGTVSRDFRLLVFFMNQFPQVPEYTIRAVSNFFENSWRYSQLKVHHRCQRHRWQMEKIFNHKSFNYLVWTPQLPPVSLTSAANLPPLSLTPVANLPPLLTTLVKLVAKLTPGVAEAGVVDTDVVDTSDAP
jgi:hypothetical protein